MNFFRKHKLYLLFQVLALVIFAHNTVFHEAGLNDGDSITHYLISKFSWQYPHLFLDNWGKPFFILLSSPLAQFGYQGMQLFNVLCATLSAWFCYRIAARLGMEFAYLAPIFLFMTPVYFIAMPSGLTEILFGLVLILCICLLVYEKPVWAAIVISFLPFCRSEGILLIPVVGLFLLWTKRFAAVPFLAFGFLVYAVIGYFYLHDFLWAINTNPYQTGDLYGHGTPWHFVEHYIPIFGNLPGILFVIATIYFIVKGYSSFKRKTPVSEGFRFEFMVLWLIVMVYFTAHSIFWWKGLFASAGLWRVMAAIAPPFSIVCMRGMTWGLQLVKNEKWGQFILSLIIEILNAVWMFLNYILKGPVWIIIIIIIIYQPINYFRMPMRLDQSKIAVREACNWVKENGLQSRKIYYSEPFTKMCLSLDPFSDAKSKEMMYVDRNNVGSDMEKNSIIIWEPGLGAHEDGIPLSKLQDASKFRLLKTFETPHDECKESGYTVYVFERE